MRNILLAVMLITLPAAAQFSNNDEDFDKNSSTGDFSIRVGALNRTKVPLNGGSPTEFSGGVALSFHLGREGLRRRLTVRVGIDVGLLSSKKVFELRLNDDVRIEHYLSIINSSIGFNVVQTSRFDLTVHYGGGLTVDNTNKKRTILFETENVCRRPEFATECPRFIGFLGNGGVGFRAFPKENGKFFLGLDYTRFAGGINQTVGTFGWAF